MKFTALQVSATGASITLAATAASANIPTDDSGRAPRYVRLSTTTAAYVRIGKGAQTAVTTDLLVTQYDSAVVAVGGADTVSALQAATGGVLIITPVDA